MICVWCKTYMSANAPLLVTGKYLRSGGFLCNKDIGMRSLTSMFWLETKPIRPTPTAYSQTSHITQRKMPSFQVDEMIIIAIVSIWYIYIYKFIIYHQWITNEIQWNLIDGGPIFCSLPLGFCLQECDWLLQNFDLRAEALMLFLRKKWVELDKSLEVALCP